MARCQPGNPIGWILVGPGVGLVFYSDSGRYSVLDYHFHHGDLPLGPAAALVASELWVGFFLALPLVSLLFPDARPSRGWRTVLWAYLGVAALSPPPPGRVLGEASGPGTVPITTVAVA